MQLEIVKASKKNLYSLKVLLRLFFPYSNQIDKIESNMSKNHEYYLLQLERKTIGFIHFTEFKTFFRLNGIAVDFPFRSKGYGKKLVEFLMEKARSSKKNITLLVDSTNISALKMYYSLNFKKTRVSKRRLNGTTLLLLKWTLKH